MYQAENVKDEKYNYLEGFVLLFLNRLGQTGWPIRIDYTKGA
jgi:hypothetical protein